MRYRTAALISTILAMATATLALPAPASAVVAGIRIKMTQPRTFIAGEEAGVGTVTVVASSAEDRRNCLRVRWSLRVRVQGVRLDQVRVNRLEGATAFPVQVQSQGDTARLTDVRFDPGSLCPGGTVTATYAVAFTGGKGSVTFQSEALDALGRVLQTASAKSEVAADKKADPSPSPSASESADPSPSPSESEEAGGAPAAAETTDPGTPPAAGNGVAQEPAAARGSGPSLLGPGLIIGAVLVFLGVALLMRVKMRGRPKIGKNQRNLPPTSFYPTR